MGLSWENASYVVTVIGLPFAIVVFMLNQRKERQNEEDEIYQKLSDGYSYFLKMLIQNADLKLMSDQIPEEQLDASQKERKKIVFELLTSLFERAYIFVYSENMSARSKRLWMSWDDYMRDWCKREDFRKALPGLLIGEDPEFGSYIRRIAEEIEQGN
ncbi:hypothetical protein ACLVWU_10645 [Bdellovibrio sp. HCB290]|uniref:hypothetical protein n=1 Tax=Bdellovibrio sp. HCB290 TaxID=3394356 RepID=UPI0039B515B6